MPPAVNVRRHVDNLPHDAVNGTYRRAAHAGDKEMVAPLHVAWDGRRQRSMERSISAYRPRAALLQADIAASMRDGMVAHGERSLCARSAGEVSNAAGTLDEVSRGRRNQRFKWFAAMTA